MFRNSSLFYSFFIFSLPNSFSFVFGSCESCESSTERGWVALEWENLAQMWDCNFFFKTQRWWCGEQLPTLEWFPNFELYMWVLWIETYWIFGSLNSGLLGNLILVPGLSFGTLVPSLLSFSTLVPLTVSGSACWCHVLDRPMQFYHVAPRRWLFPYLLLTACPVPVLYVGSCPHSLVLVPDAGFDIGNWSFKIQIGFWILITGFLF